MSCSKEKTEEVIDRLKKVICPKNQARRNLKKLIYATIHKNLRTFPLIDNLM